MNKASPLNGPQDSIREALAADLLERSDLAMELEQGPIGPFPEGAVWVLQLEEGVPSTVTVKGLAAAVEAGRFTPVALCDVAAGRQAYGRHPVRAAFWQINRAGTGEGVQWRDGVYRRGGLPGDLFIYVSPRATLAMRILAETGRFVKPRTE